MLNNERIMQRLCQLRSTRIFHKNAEFHKKIPQSIAWLLQYKPISCNIAVALQPVQS